MVKKIYFPRIILPLSVVLTNMINYLYCMVIVLIVLPITGIGYSWYIIWFPVIFIIETIFIYAMCLILSALNVLYRDVEHIIGIVTMAWFYGTPILYNISVIPEKVARIYKLNPMVGIISGYRDILFYKQAPNIKFLIYDLIIGIILTIIGTQIFNHISKKFGEEL